MELNDPGTKSMSAPAILDSPTASPGVRCSDMVGLLAAGLEAAEGARVLADCYFERDGRDGYNNDNYCRLLDWIKDARRALGKQPNAEAHRPAEIGKET